MHPDHDPQPDLRDILDDLAAMRDSIGVHSVCRQIAGEMPEAILDLLTQLAPDAPVVDTSENARRGGPGVVFDTLLLVASRAGMEGLAPILVRYGQNAGPHPAVTQAWATLADKRGLDVCLRALRAGAHPRTGIDPGDRVATGVIDAARAGRGDQEFLGPVFEALASPIRRGDVKASVMNAEDALLAIDRERALRLFAEPGVCRVASPVFSGVLRAMNVAEATWPPDQIVQLLGELDDEPDEDERGAIRADLLTMLSRAHPDGSRALLEQSLDHPQRAVRDAAASAILDIDGMMPYIPDETWPLEKKWKPEHRVVATIARAYLCVCNGGLSAIFVNNHPLWWREAAAAMDAAGATASAGMLRQLGEKAGLADPRLRDKDVGQWRRPDGLEELEERLQPQWSADPDHLFTRVCRYMQGHKKLFRAGKRPTNG